MKTQTVVSFLCVLSLCLLRFGVTQDLDDDDSTVVTTEEEENSIDEDIVYESPIPTGNVYLAEHFDDLDKFKKKWVLSEAKKEDIDENIAKYDGVWEVESPVKDGLKGDMGLVLKSKAKHAAISARLDKPFTFVEKPLIVQYEVVLQEGQECGGAYLKLLSAGKDTSDLRSFHDKTPYTIMFGPDKCGNDHKLHFIFRHKNPKNGTLTEKHCKKSKDRLEEPFKDKQPHLYTLVLKPDNSYTISLDRKVINEGNLLDDFTPPVNPPAEIDDPDDKKPENWDEREKIPDPEAQKPDDWDEDAPAMIPDTAATKPDGWLEDELEMISDPTAEKPDDWDSDMDGDWEAPLIPNPVCESAPGCGPWKAPLISNPNYKGKWRAPMIENPNYKGKWKPRRIPNPDFFEDKTPFRMTTISAVGFELWSMSNMILFDNIIITDDALVAERWALDTFSLKRRKIDKDSETMWEQVMRSINYKPGWWGLYFVYCIIPVAAYVWYLYSRVAEESLLMRLVKYTNEQPWLWAVYVVVIGLPVVLVLVFCCGSSNKEKEEQRRAAEAKKTDALSPDDEPEDEVDMRPRNPVASSKSDLEVPEEKEENDDDIGDQKNNKEDGESQSDVEEEANHTGAGDAPRSPKKRRPRRE